MERITVLKTYKLYIGGQFPRSESGRYYSVLNSKNQIIANACLSSRKDFRNAVVAARVAFAGWSDKTSFNRGQILYRVAEMLEGRKTQFTEELMKQGLSKKEAVQEVELSIERWVYYSGWCDKYQALFSSVNPVASPHFNFSVPEPMGVVSVIAPEKPSLLGFISVIAPVIAGGNTCVVLASEKQPLCCITFCEVLATSDLPSGVINCLTGTSGELHSYFASHMDVNAVIYCRNNKQEIELIGKEAAVNVKRVFHLIKKWNKESDQNPYLINDLQEIKTTWHPIENTGARTNKY